MDLEKGVLRLFLHVFFRFVHVAVVPTSCQTASNNSYAESAEV